MLLVEHTYNTCTNLRTETYELGHCAQNSQNGMYALQRQINVFAVHSLHERLHTNSEDFVQTTKADLRFRCTPSILVGLAVTRLMSLKHKLVNDAKK